jgi:hypothetical protein
MMKAFELPKDLRYNTDSIKDPTSYFKESSCTSWLCLTGEEFAEMENGMSFEQVQQVAPVSMNVVSDPPKTLNLELAQQHVKALDSLPRPTLISCRMGPRASAVAYMYSGLKLNANPNDVITAAENDNAPFTKFDEYKEWVRSSIESLSKDSKEG